MAIGIESSSGAIAPSTRTEHASSGWWALLATAFVVLLPSAAITAVIELSDFRPNIFLVWGATATLSAALLFVGTAWWMRQPGSTTMTFAELMFWRWIRRQRADERLERARVLVTESGAREEDVATTRHGQLRLLKSLNAALETRDPYTRGHARRVERHCYRTALAMQLPTDDVFNLRLAASLHDIGKIRVPIEIIRKQGPLDDAEWAIMKKHSAIGAHIIANIGNEKLVGAVRHHHERWDGTGYPDGISGEDIPLHARIIAVCDAFDAITSNRPYRSKSDRKKAISIIEEQAGKQFDPVVARAFLDGLPRGLPGLAALSWVGLPALRKVASQFVVALQQAGTLGVAGAIAAGGVTGVVASSVHPSKYLGRPAVEKAQAAPARDAGSSDSKRTSSPAIASDERAAASGATSVRGKLTRKSDGHSSQAHRSTFAAKPAAQAKGKAIAKGLAGDTAVAQGQLQKEEKTSGPQGKAKGKAKQESEAADTELASASGSSNKVGGGKGNSDTSRTESSGSDGGNDGGGSDDSGAVETEGPEATTNGSSGKSNTPKRSAPAETDTTDTSSTETDSSETETADEPQGKGRDKPK